MSESSQENKTELDALATEIWEALGEKDHKPRRQIFLIADKCGVDFARQLLADTLEIEAQGGMFTKDESRRRTPGGIFFHLARERMDDDIRQNIFYTWRAVTQRQLDREKSYEPFEYENRAEVVENLQNETGKVEQVRITLVGRPGKVERRQQLVILQMQDDIGEKIALPTGVPRPDPTPMNYTVYMSFKHWDRIETALENPKDEMILDGFCAFDEETNGVAVFATYATTRKLHRKERKAAKHQSIQEQAEEAKKQKKKPKTQEKTRQEARMEVAPPQPPPPPEVEIHIPSGIPEDAAQKLIELHKAAATFREKIAGLEEKPPDQRFGLEMTQKLLANTLGQIENLEKQFAGNDSDS